MKSRLCFISLLFTLGAAMSVAQNTDVKAPALKDFCKDSRAAIRTFCQDLKQLQTEVNKAVEAKKKLDPQDFKNILNRLDLQHIDSRSTLLKFLGPKAASKQAFKAISSVAKSVTSEAASVRGQQRVDQQLSPGSTSSGTTSLVSKAGSAELLSLALDTGALTRSVNGTTATLTTNADQIFRLITNDDPDCTATCVDSGWFHKRILSPLTFAASLDLAQRGTTTTPTTGQASGTTSTPVSSATIPTGAGKLSSFIARYEVANKFDPRSPKFKENWDNELKIQNLGPLSDDIKNATDAVKNTLQAKAPKLEREVILKMAGDDPSGPALADYYFRYASSAADAILQDANIQVQVGQIMQNRGKYRDAWFQALNDAAGTMLTFEYNYNRPLNQPLTHDFKIIYGYDFGVHGMVTANGAFSIYNTIPGGAKYGRLHYGQASLEYDRNLRAYDSSMQSQITLAGYWQYQPHPSILNIPAGTVAPGTNIPLPNGTQEFVGTAGSLWVTQAKLTIKASGGINIPIGVSWSNKTDLLRGSKIGAQVGISYNFSSLAGLLTGSGGQ